MLSDEIITKIKEILQDNKKGISYLTNELEMKEYSKEEQRIIYILTEINELYICFKYKDNPYSYLKEIIQESDRKYIRYFADLACEKRFKAKIYDFLWTCFKDYDSSQKAYTIYGELIRDESVSHEDYFYYLIRAFSIIASTGNKPEKIEEIQELVSLYIDNNLEDETFRQINLLEMFVEEKVGDNDFLIEIANKKINMLGDKFNTHAMEAYLNLLEKLYALKNNTKLNKVVNDKDILKVRRLKADYYLKQAKELSGNIFMVVENYKNAVNILKTLPNTNEERVSILKEMEPYQKKILDSMQQFKYDKDISTEVKKIIEPIKGKDILFSLKYFTFSMPLIKEESLKQGALNNARKFVFSALFSSVVLDKKGKVKYKLPSILDSPSEADIVANAHNEFMNDANIYSQVYVIPVLSYIIENLNINEETVNNIVNNNVFIPEERKVSFKKGILAGFKYDFITALSILLPQVENSIRFVAELCGDVIYSNNEEGVEQLKTLNDVLDLPCLNEALESDLIFNMKSIFASKYGLNMRNDVAHGNLDDTEFNSMYAIYTWYFILKLCCMNSRWILCEKS